MSIATRMIATALAIAEHLEKYSQEPVGQSPRLSVNLTRAEQTAKRLLRQIKEEKDQ